MEREARANLPLGGSHLQRVGRRYFMRAPFSFLVSFSEQVFLMLSNLSNKAGVKYLIKNNVENLFTRMIGEGKATIRYTND